MTTHPDATPLQWRPAVKAAMRDAAREELAHQHDADHASFNYRWEHVKVVAALALKLAELTGADAEVVEAAAWLHDVRKTADADHAQAGAAFARRFLSQTDFPTQKIEAAAAAIAAHRGLWREEPLTRLESQILWDADKLAKIGLTAVFHWTGGALAGDRLHTVAELIENGRDAAWQEKTVASMHTAPARRAARARLAAYNQLWERLEAELNGDDLVDI
jgi:uncharacterized protein